MSSISRRRVMGTLGAAAFTTTLARQAQAQTAKPYLRLQSWPLNTRQATAIHDLAPAPDGGVWFTAQRSGHLGYFDPQSGQTELIALRRTPVAARRDCRPRPSRLDHR